MAKLKQEDLLRVARQKIDEKMTSLPEVEIPEFESKVKGGDEETMVLLLSDVHFGHKTPTTSFRIISNRLERLAKRITKIANIHRQCYPVRKLVVFMLGDMVQGDIIGRFVSLDELEDTVMKQVFDWAVPELSKFFLGLQEHFEEIEVYCVKGNHGAVRKDAGEDTSWDLVVYEALERRLERPSE